MIYCAALKDISVSHNNKKILDINAMFQNINPYKTVKPFSQTYRVEGGGGGGGVIKYALSVWLEIWNDC